MIGFSFSWGSRPLGQPWHSIALGLVSVICAAGALYFHSETERFVALAEPLQGVVLALEEADGRYYPIVEYELPGRGVQRFVSSAGSKPAAFDVGETVPLLYNPNERMPVRLSRYWSLWGGGITFGIVSFAFGVGAILLWVFRRQVYALAGYPELDGRRKGTRR